MRVTVCVAAFRASSLKDCLDSLLAQSSPDWEAMIVGQGAHDLEVRSLVEQYAETDNRFRYLHVPEVGANRARNAGACAATGEIIAFTDDDCIADEHWLSTMLGSFEEDPTLDLVGGTVVVAPPKGRWRISTCPGVIPTASVYRPGPGVHPPAGWGWIGCNFAVRRAVVEQIDELFDVSLGPGTEFPAADDTDLTLRFERKRLSMLSTPRSVVHHAHGRRYGFRSVLRQVRAYGLGNGALGGKLTLLGDPRGLEWKRLNRHECLTSWMPIRIHRIPSNLWRLFYWNLGYRRCLRKYLVPAGSEVLQRRCDP